MVVDVAVDVVSVVVVVVVVVTSMQPSPSATNKLPHSHVTLDGQPATSTAPMSTVHADGLPRAIFTTFARGVVHQVGSIPPIAFPSRFRVPRHARPLNAPPRMMVRTLPERSSVCKLPVGLILANVSTSIDSMSFFERSKFSKYFIPKGKEEVVSSANLFLANDKVLIHGCSLKNLNGGKVSRSSFEQSHAVMVCREVPDGQQIMVAVDVVVVTVVIVVVVIEVVVVVVVVVHLPSSSLPSSQSSEPSHCHVSRMHDPSPHVCWLSSLQPILVLIFNAALLSIKSSEIFGPPIISIAAMPNALTVYDASLSQVAASPRAVALLISAVNKS